MLTDADRAKVLDALAAVDRAVVEYNRAVAEIRATLTGPPVEMRLPGGDVAYQTIRAGEVAPGMWVRCDNEWKQVIATQAGDMSGDVVIVFDPGPVWFGSVDTKVKVASTVDGARMAAERQAQRAEAYDAACEAR